MKSAMNIETPKNIYVVLGMSRSGTSAIARSLITLGIHLGDKLLKANELNPTGFWEDADILYNINRGVSAAINHTYMDTDANQAELIEAHPVLNQYKQNAVKLVSQRLANTQDWGFKDPRTVTILPFWQSVFAALKVEDRYVIVMRNPIATAQSNQKFIECDLEEGMLIWLRQLFRAIDGTQGKKRIVVSYELMLEDPRLQLQRMHRELGIVTPLDEEQVNAYANQFINKDLRHFECGHEDIQSHPVTSVFPLCLRLYALLLGLAKDEIHVNDPAFLTEWQVIQAEYKKIQPLYTYVDTLLKRNKELERKIRTLHKSFIWRLAYPFRCLDETWRNQRRKMKAKKKLLRAYD